ncbi:MAG: DNA methylase [Oscillospiraceae bacterium]|nr:DNA methylase [Oscillospiraceae bacterium]
MKSYIAIDLKSFYASQECVERELDPMSTNLVVADGSRTEKTICLAVSPSLKAFGISGRARLFEVIQRVKEINAMRLTRAPGRKFTGKSCDANALNADPSLELDYIIAPPRMAHYMECSTRIYEIYLKYVAPEDIHVYSIDEVFIDATPYLKTYGLTPREFARKLIYEVLENTGITATAGIGTNLYLCKIAMDIVAKRTEPDEYGVRIAQLDEMSYRQTLWGHRPLTDFWRVGRGYARKLEKHGIFTMGDIARCSIHNEQLFYKLFGINAELLIDHAWGWEPTTIADIKAYRPTTNSLGSGQVLHEPYTWDKARIIVREMVDLLVLDLVDKGLVTDQIVLTVGYDRENLTDPERRKHYHGEVVRDPYGREIPKHAHGTAHLERMTSSTRLITDAMMNLFDRITDPNLLVRRVNIVACRITPEVEVPPEEAAQLDFFMDYAAKEKENLELEREKRRQQAVLAIRKKFGKNAILKGMNYQEGATTRDRNAQIGGHKA